MHKDIPPYNDAPEWAFICAAGLGKRMRDLTQNCPKPLITINNRTLLDYIVDHLLDVGITDIVLNTHYLHDQIEEWANNRTAQTPALKLTLYYEEELLDTGGGIASVLAQTPERQDKSFFMINGDAFWLNHSAQHKTLDQMITQWVDGDAQLLLLLEDVKKMVLTQGIGDYNIVDGQPKRSKDKSGPYMFTGVRIVHPTLLQPLNIRPHSFLNYMDLAENQGSLEGFIDRGEWHHISTPEDVQTVNDNITKAISSSDDHCTKLAQEAC